MIYLYNLLFILKTSIYWNSIYKFVKLIKYLKTDNSFILNKYGIDDIIHDEEISSI